MPVTIAQGAEAAIIYPGAGMPPATLLLQANGAPGGGTYQWTIRAPGVVQFVGATNLNALTIAAVAPGTTSVDVTYSSDNSVATIIIDVIQVTVQPVPSANMVYPGAGNPAATLALQATGTPAGGTYGWAVTNNLIAQLQGAVNQAAATVASVGPGTTLATASYTVGNQTATASTTINVLDLTLNPYPVVGMAYPGAGMPPATQVIQAAGTPGGGAYAWQMPVGAAQFQNNINPGNAAQATIETVAPGTTSANVTYTIGAAVAQETVTIDVLNVTVAPTPSATILPPATQQFQAAGTPNGGAYAWTVANPNIAQFQGPINQATATLAPVSAGSTGVTVTYTASGRSVTATTTLNVVGVTVTPTPSGTVVPPNTQQFQAVGLPNGGTYAWTAANPNIARFEGPINQATATLSPLAPGATQVNVAYTFGGQTANISTALNVVGVTVTPTPSGTVVPPNTQQFQATGTPLGGTYAWTVTNGAIAQFQGATNLMTATLAPVAAGSTPVNVAYTFGGQTANAATALNVVGVTVTPTPSGTVVPPNTQQFQATGTPNGGTYAWTVTSPNIAQFQGPTNLATATLSPVTAGSTPVNVAYTFGGQTANVSTALNVVGVTVAPSPSASVVLPNTQQFQATGTPNGGTYAWAVTNGAIAQFQGPTNLATATLNPLATGSTPVNVAYTFGGQTANVSTTFNVVSVTLNPSPATELVYPGVGAPPNTRLLQAVGTPGGGAYAWQVNGAAARFQGGVAPGNANSATIETVTPGACTVDVTYTIGAGIAQQTVNVDVVGLTVVPAPTAPMLYPGAGVLPAATTALTATGLPVGGTYAWFNANPVVADFQGGPPGNVGNVTMESVGPGAATVGVTYTIRTAAPAAQTSVEVIAIDIQEGEMMGGVRVLGVLHPSVGMGTQNLTSLAAPAGGAPTWRAIPLPAGVIQYQGGVATVNNLNATIQTLATGTKTVTVQYVQSGLTATSAIELRVRDVGCSCVTWAPAGAANVAPRARTGCPHGPGGFVPTRYQYPTLGPPGVATAAPTTPHHHGTRCFYCALNGRGIDHWVDPYGAAMNDVLTLRNEIQALRNLLVVGGWNPAAPPPNPMPAAATNYINGVGGPPRPWLAGVPVWLYNPAAVPGQGIMLGVLRGVDGAGNQYLLRAASGLFPGIILGPAQNGVPNAYWSRPLQNALQIYSASRGPYGYPPQGGTFGKCAAARLLAHALLLQLRVDSMAEIWIGATLNARIDGQLQASCNNCRIYFEHMLCDQGAVARGVPVFINGAVPPAVPNFGF